MVRMGPLLRGSITLAMLVVTIAAPAVASARQPGVDAGAATSPEAWARAWDTEREQRPAAPLWTHADVQRELQRLARETPDLFSLETIGASIEGRPIQHLSVGRGPLPILLWSQMHGDEPSATPALIDAVEYLRRHRGEPGVARLLDALTLHIVPMLNPDGAQRFERRNAQGIDINRDALRLQTPEGRALKALRDRVSARVGFNLHNQSWRTSVGRPPRPATISLLSVAYDEARTENEGRRLTKKLCAVIRDALEPFAAGQLGRYDDEFEVRAFGDNVTKWGTPVVLIESGPWPGPEPDLALTRLNFVAIMSALEALATGRVETADPQRYETLPMNEDRLFHTLVSGATVAAGTGVPPFIADVGIGVTRVVRGGASGRRIELVGRIEDVGDLRVFGALETIDATGKWVAPLPLEGAVRAGDEVALPEARDRAKGPVILPGQPGALMILVPAERAGRYRVERVIRFDDRRR
jgi:hypothetical protein